MEPPNLICTICQDIIDPEAAYEEEKIQKLDCSHIFHRECIGTWLLQRHNCPLCRARVTVITPEAPQPQMTLQEILAVPDPQAQNHDLPIDDLLRAVRNAISRNRQVRRLHLHENSQVADTARKTDALAGRFFGF